MAVVDVSVGSTFSFGEERALFDAFPYRADRFHKPYDITPDGGRLVMIRIEDGPIVESVVVVEGFGEELRRRVSGS